MKHTGSSYKVADAFRGSKGSARSRRQSRSGRLQGVLRPQAHRAGNKASDCRSYRCCRQLAVRCPTGNAHSARHDLCLSCKTGELGFQVPRAEVEFLATQEDLWRLFLIALPCKMHAVLLIRTHEGSVMTINNVPEILYTSRRYRVRSSREQYNDHNYVRCYYYDQNYYYYYCYYHNCYGCISSVRYILHKGHRDCCPNGQLKITNCN
jgi:hypothetical protein